MNAEGRQPARIENGEPVDLPGRADSQPQLWRIPSHSKIPTGVPTNNIYMYLEDTDSEQMGDKYDASRHQALPRGYQIIGPGDYIICRDKWGSGREEDDDIVMFVPATEIIEPYRNEIDVARDAALGEVRERDQHKARLDEEGVWQGGIAFERSHLAVNVEGAARCYTLGQSYQVQRKLTGPSVGAKVDGEILNHHKLRQSIMKASARVGIATLEAGDEETCDALREQANCINLPSLGDACNYAFPTMQLNIASTQRGSSGSGTLQNELGGFGVPHADENDSPAGMTVLIANSNLGATVKPGFFLNVELGIAVELTGFVTCCFSGLRQHGGYPPMDFSGGDPEDWSYRFVVVCYPPKQMLDGDSSLALGALPKQKLFHMPPEMIHPRYDGETSTTNNATWIASGPIMTDPEAYLQWYYQSHCQQLAFFHRQVRVNSEMQIDLEALSKVFYLQDEAGHKTYPEPWDLRPEEKHFAARAEAMKRWDAFKAKKAKILPYMYRSGRNPAAVVSMPAEEQSNETNAKQTHAKSRKRKQCETAPLPLVEEQTRPNNSKRQKKARGGDRQLAETQASKTTMERRKPRPKNAQKDWAELPYCPQKEVLARPTAQTQHATGSGMRIVRSSASSHSSHLPGRADNDVRASRFSTPNYSLADDVTEGIQDNLSSDLVMAIDPWQQEAEDMLSVQASTQINTSPTTPHFQPVLDVLSLRGLVEEFEYVEGLVSGLSEFTSGNNIPETVDRFLHAFGQDDRMHPQFALQCAQMWPCHQARRPSADLFGLVLAVERRGIMLSSAMAWYWLTQDCASSVLRDASLLQDDPSCLDHSDSWLTNLTRDVWQKLSRRDSDRAIHPSDYLPNCPSTLSSLYVTRHGNDSSPNTVCIQTIAILRQWLNFPTNSELLSAYFVLHLVDVCGGNTDVLLLRGIWRPYKEIKASVLNMRSQRWSSLRLSHLIPFAEALRTLPIADKSSMERTVLDHISVAIKKCTLHIPTFADVTSAMHLMPGPYPLPANNVPATSVHITHPHIHALTPSIQPASSASSRPAPSQHTHFSSPAPSLDRTSGLDALAEFLYDLLPLARGELPVSAIQQLVMSDADRYLPFRNLAPTRRAVTAAGGPFHPDNVRKPGAFPSCVINRALTFNTPAAKDEGNPTLFSNEEAWDAFKAQHNFSASDKASLAYFFNVTCYGSAQGTRHQGMEDVEVYFAAERDWTKLVSDCGGKVPFLQFFQWAKQQVKRADKVTRKSRSQARLPLVGKLTAFLLAADLSYSGLVEPPTAEEVGTVIYKNGLGSRAGLVGTGQISGKDASQEEIAGAFKGVMEYLQEIIDDEDRQLVGFDAIMVEHLLCKFQRVHRELPSFKGKGI